MTEKQSERKGEEGRDTLESYELGAHVKVGESIREWVGEQLNVYCELLQTHKEKTIITDHSFFLFLIHHQTNYHHIATKKEREKTCKKKQPYAREIWGKRKNGKAGYVSG
jgi:hypothetical protein